MSTTAFSLTKDVLDFQIAEEATRNTFSGGTVVTGLFVAQTPEITYDSELNLALNRVTGARDPAHVLATMKDVRFALLIPNILNPEGINFLKRGINLEAPASGDISRLFSGCLRIKLGGTQYYLKMKGMMIGAGTVSLQGSGPWTANVWMQANLEAFDTSAPTGWTFASAPTTVPLMSLGAGANPVSIRDVDASQTYTPSVRALSFGFNNFVFPIPEVGLDTYKDVVPTARGVQVRYVCNLKDTNFFGIHTAGHECNSTITMLSGKNAITITVTGGKIAPSRIPITMDTPLIESHTHIGKSAVLAIA